MGRKRQVAMQVLAATSTSRVQATPSEQLLGQAPGEPGGMAMSHVSPLAAWTTPSPQVLEQSGSFAAVQPSAQQPSLARWHTSTRWSSQCAVQSVALPTSMLSRHADGEGGQDVGQASSP